MFAGMADKVDIEATIDGGGPTGQSGAIRWGIAWGLRSFVDKPMIEKMRVGKKQLYNTCNGFLQNYNAIILRIRCMITDRISFLNSWTSNKGLAKT